MYIIKNKAGKLQVLCESDCFEQHMISGELRVGVLVPRVLWSIVRTNQKNWGDGSTIHWFICAFGGWNCLSQMGFASFQPVIPWLFPSAYFC